MEEYLTNTESVNLCDSPEPLRGLNIIEITDYLTVGIVY